MLPLTNTPDSRNWFKYIFGASPPPPEPVEPPTDPSSVARFTFGLVADVQTAQLATVRGVKGKTVDGRKVNIRRRRAWRESIPKLYRIVGALNKSGVDFVVNLGDLIEGYGAGDKRNAHDFEQVVRVFERFAKTVVHVIGNHCRQIPLTTLMDTLGLENPYYAFTPCKGWRFIVLHTAELYSGAVDTLEEDRASLKKILEENECEKHHFHGAMTEVQLSWLHSQLVHANSLNEKVVVLSHYPLAKGSGRDSHVLANSAVVRKIIEGEYSTVIACLAGHDHMGGSLHIHTAFGKPISYITIPALLECPSQSTAYAIVTCYTNGKIHINGHGSVPSYILPHEEEQK